MQLSCRARRVGGEGGEGATVLINQGLFPLQQLENTRFFLHKYPFYLRFPNILKIRRETRSTVTCPHSRNYHFSRHVFCLLHAKMHSWASASRKLTPASAIPASRILVRYRTLTWTCSIDMDMQHGHGHALWTCTCSMGIDTQHSIDNAACIWTMDMHGCQNAGMPIKSSA